MIVQVCLYVTLAIVAGVLDCFGPFSVTFSVIHVAIAVIAWSNLPAAWARIPLVTICVALFAGFLAAPFHPQPAIESLVAFGLVVVLMIRKFPYEKLEQDSRFPFEPSATMRETRTAAIQSLLNGEQESKVFGDGIDSQYMEGEDEESTKLFFGDDIDEMSSAEISINMNSGHNQFGDYSIVSLIAKGGSSHVFHAKHIETGRDTALKIISRSYTQPRFKREMSIVQKLCHPNIVVSYEAGCVGKRMFIAMEYVKGKDLSNLVHDNGPFPKLEVFKYIYQTAVALEHAHERKLVHRDVKPGNLLLTETGIVKLSDLGLAASTMPTNLEDDGTFKTEEGMVGGTIDFMAPEQAITLSDSNPQSDIFSLGATAYYLLTGQPYLLGGNFADRYRNLTIHRRFAALEKTKLAKREREVLANMLAYDVKDRIANCGELRDQLQGILSDLGCDSPEQTVHILVVEDDDFDLLNTIRILKETNRSVETVEAQTFKEAESLMAGQRFDVVILDLNLPDASGIETVERFQALNRHDTPIIVVTGLPDEELETQCRRRGAIDFAVKGQFDVQRIERQIFVAVTQNRASI